MRHATSHDGLVCALLGVLVVFASGCGGGGTSMAEMRRHAMKRASNDKDEQEEEREAEEAAKPKKAAESDGKKSAETTDEETDNPAAPSAVAAEQASPPPAAAADAGGASARGTATVATAQAETGTDTPAPPPNAAPKSEAQLRKEQTIKNLERIAKALRSYVSANKRFPITKNELSWRVRLLPYVGEKALYGKFAPNAGWNGSKNQALLAEMPDVFRSPANEDGEQTNYQMVSGRGAIHNSGAGVFPEDLDGVCLVVVETTNDASVPWTQPKDFGIRKNGITGALGSVSRHGFFGILSNYKVAWITADASDGLLYQLLRIDTEGGEELIQAPAVALTLPDEVAAPDEVAMADESASIATSDPPASANAGETVGSSEVGPQVRRPPTIGEVASVLQTSPASVSAFQLPKKPKGQALKEARDLLSELYQEEYAEAKTPEERLELADKMMERLPDIHGDSAGEYALLNIVQQIAVKAGDVELAMNSARLLTAKFDLGEDDFELETLTKLARTVKDDGRQDIIDQAGAFFAGYMERRDYRRAITTSQLAVSAAKRLNDDDLFKEWSRSHVRSEEARKAFLGAERGLKALEENPKDEEASTAVGRYLCFYEGDWENGVAILANGHDRSLRRLATLELADPQEASESLKIADLWWSEAEQAHTAEKGMMQRRAGGWYSRALPGLPAGLVRLRVERRLEEIEEEAG